MVHRGINRDQNKCLPNSYNWANPTDNKKEIRLQNKSFSFVPWD